MSAVVDAVTNVVCSVVSGVSDVVGTVADTAANTIEKALDDPIKTIAMVAAVASGNPQLIPLVNGTDKFIETGCLGAALKGAAISTVTHGVMEGITCGLCIDSCGFCTPCCVDLCGVCSPCVPCSPCMPCGGSLPDGCTPSTCLPSVDTPVCGPSTCMPCGGLPTGCTPSTCVPSTCAPCGSSCMCSCMSGCNVCCSPCISCNTCNTTCCSCNSTCCMPTGCAPSSCAPCCSCYSPVCCACTCCSSLCCSPCCAPCDTCDPCDPFKIKLKLPKTKTPRQSRQRNKNTCNMGAPNSTTGQKGPYVDPVLCTNAKLLGETRRGNKRNGLKKVNTGNINAGYMAPKNLNIKTTEVGGNLGYECCSNNLGYAKGGTADKLESNTDILKCAIKTWNEAFCEKKLYPIEMCQKAELMHQTGAPAKNCLSPLKHLYSSIGSSYAKGGLSDKYQAAAPKGHNPEFITGVTGYYACGKGTGQSDDIPAMLHDGDYVMDAETVSALGDGSSKAGNHVLDGFRKQVPHKAEGGSNPVPAKIADGEYVFPAAFVTALGGGDNRKGSEILDGLRTKLRAHKRGAPLSKIPPKAKDPIDYIKKGSK